MDFLGVHAFFGGPIVLGFAAALVLSTRVRRGGNALAAIGLPVLYAVLLLLARALFWDPDNNCTQECWGTTIYAMSWVLATIGAELGLVAGGTTKYLRSRS
jgi:hypothetical protein